MERKPIHRSLAQQLIHTHTHTHARSQLSRLSILTPLSYTCKEKTTKKPFHSCLTINKRPRRTPSRRQSQHGLSAPCPDLLKDAPKTSIRDEGQAPADNDNRHSTLDTHINTHIQHCLSRHHHRSFRPWSPIFLPHHPRVLRSRLAHHSPGHHCSVSLDHRRIQRSLQRQIRHVNAPLHSLSVAREPPFEPHLRGLCPLVAVRAQRSSRDVPP
jgi:hypothetical protein